MIDISKLAIGTKGGAKPAIKEKSVEVSQEMLNLEGYDDQSKDYFGEVQQLSEVVSPSSYKYTPEQATRIMSSAKQLMGLLTVVGNDEYYLYLKQSRTVSTWMLFREDSVLPNGRLNAEGFVGLLKIFTTGKILGKGSISVLLRLLDSINEINTKVALRGEVTNGYEVSALYREEQSSDYISYSLFERRVYTRFEMNYDGFIVNLRPTTVPSPLSIKDSELEIVPDSKAESAIIANLGIKTFDLLRASKGEALNYIDRKNYQMVDTEEKFNTMIGALLDSVQVAHDSKRAILIGIDTETTGLQMYKLSSGNQAADHIVSIQISWKTDAAYLICMDMAYFNNVPSGVVYPIFDKLFGRGRDLGDRTIELDWQGRHYSFQRNNIITTAHNAMFDKMAFMCHGVNIYFDEDTLIGMYDLAPGLVKGHNGLKEWSRAIWDEETLELDELFGKGHEDKFRYLQDARLALVYGCADPDYCRELDKVCVSKQDKVVRAQYKRYDIPIMNILAEAAWRGMPVETEEALRQGQSVYDDIEQLKEFVYRYAFYVYRENMTNRVGQLANILGIDDSTADETIKSLLNKSEREGMFRFKFTPDNLKNFLFDILNYPVLKVGSNGRPSMDKYVLDKLARVPASKDTGILKHDVVSRSGSGKVLISAAEFNRKQYPIAQVLITYATLNKEYTSYYRPLVENDLEGRMFYGFNMAYAATRRILSPGQTMKGSLKSLVKSPKGKLVMCFDASQIEFRLMASLAYGLKKAKLKQAYPKDWEERLHHTPIYDTYVEMQKEEADYHIQTASQMTKTKKHLVTPKVRKRYKKVGFGIPYGLSVMSLCEDLHGKVTDETLKDTQELMDDFCSKAVEIIDLLEGTRDSAFVPAVYDEQVKSWLGLDGVPIGCVYDLVGFKFSFALKDLTRKHTARIRRQVGNCIIQGGAAELFRRMILNFYKASVAEGLESKIEWFMVVHDELDTLIDDDIDVIKLIEVIYKNCTLRYEDQIPYYVGIGFGYSWGEAKDDASELPVIMVERLIDAYHKEGFRIPSDGQQPVNLLKLKRHYLCDRLEEELKKLFPTLGVGFEWTEEKAARVDKDFENYIVRAYLSNFVRPEHGNGASLLIQLQDWQAEREKYGFGVKFTQEKFKDARAELESMEFTSNDGEFEIAPEDLDAFDLGDDEEISVSVEDLGDLEDLETDLRLGMQNDLLSNEDNEVDSDYFGEDSLFDQNIAAEDVVKTESDNKHAKVTLGLGKKKDAFEVNANATSAFDILVSKKYRRRHIMKSAENAYMLDLDGTPFEGDIRPLVSKIKSKSQNGVGQLIVMGKSVDIIESIELNEDFLNTIDKVVCGEIVW